jgi:hypothetical protein
LSTYRHEAEIKRIRPPGRTSSCTDHLLPTLKSLGAQHSIIYRLHQVMAKAKEILGEFMEREKTWRLIR